MLLGVLLSVAQAAELGGYFRVQARPDWMEGDGRLGTSSLYGRLMNEGPWALVDLRQDLVKRTPGGDDPWGDLHLRVEGGAIGNADASSGNLASFRMSQFYLQAGNVALEGVTWRVGTLETTFGDLWLYDTRPTQMFVDVLGAQATWKKGKTQVDLAVGDAGWSTYGLDYRSLPSGGGAVRQGLGEHLDVGIGAQTWVLGDDLGYKIAGYVGFGKLGALTWDRVQVVYKRPLADPASPRRSDQRAELFVGNELELDLGDLDVAWATQLARTTDADAPKTDRTAVSTVVRGQVEVAPTVAVLAETAVGRELDAVATRDTWQGKGGLVLSPAGGGMGARPALRFLYGAQYSTAPAAWPGAAPREQSKWHHLVAVEAETWF